jgi:hypothetical protein
MIKTTPCAKGELHTPIKPQNFKKKITHAKNILELGKHPMIAVAKFELRI